MSIMTKTIVRANRADHAAMLADGHRGAWQTKKATFVVATSATTSDFGAAEVYVTNPKGNRAWGPPSA